MSYPIGLDEYPTAKLREELDNRELALAVGRCDYCGRPGDSNVCRFPERHAVAQKALRELRAVEARRHVCGLAGYDGMRDPPCPGCEFDHGRTL